MRELLSHVEKKHSPRQLSTSHYPPPGTNGSWDKEIQVRHNHHLTFMAIDNRVQRPIEKDGPSNNLSSTRK